MHELSKTDTGKQVLTMDSGEQFFLQMTGCFEGIAVFDKDMQYLTAVEVEEPHISVASATQDDIDTVAAAITGLNVNAAVKNGKKGFAKLKEAIAVRMKEKGIIGTLFRTA